MSEAIDTCRKCGGSDLKIRYVPHCDRRDCDHKHCGDKLQVICAVCGFMYKRRPLDAR